jgi:hypothetical protein
MTHKILRVWDMPENRENFRFFALNGSSLPFLGDSLEVEWTVLTFRPRRE